MIAPRLLLQLVAQAIASQARRQQQAQARAARVAARRQVAEGGQPNNGT